MQITQNSGAEGEYKREILEKERKIFYLEKRIADLRLEIPERTLWQKYGPYIIVFACFLLVQFLNNWVVFYMNGEIPMAGLGIVFLILLGLDVWRDRRKREQQEKIRTIRCACDRLQEELRQLREEMGQI